MVLDLMEKVMSSMGQQIVICILLNSNEVSMKAVKKTKQRPSQKQNSPGIQTKMRPQPEVERNLQYLKLSEQVAIITGGDSGIGQAVAVAFAKEGANVAIVYLK